MVLPDVEWFENKLYHTYASSESNRAFWSKMVSHIAEHCPKHERDAVLLRLDWIRDADQERWNWKEECWEYLR